MELTVSQHIVLKRPSSGDSSRQHASTQPDSSERLSSTPAAVYFRLAVQRGVLCIL